MPLSTDAIELAAAQQSRRINTSDFASSNIVWRPNHRTSGEPSSPLLPLISAGHPTEKMSGHAPGPDTATIIIHSPMSSIIHDQQVLLIIIIIHKVQEPPRERIM
jgi:hypothetical protein